jgi:hypothetical protein
MSSFLVGSEKRYVDTYVDPAYLASLKKAMDDEHSPKKYGKFKAWLHYANLQRWQNQGWHYAYLNYNGKELHCTCGLAVELNSKSDINIDIQEKWAPLNLDLVQLQTGHRNLPSLKGQTSSFLVNFSWVEKGDFYTWDGICQGCGKSSTAMTNPAVHLFKRTHLSCSDGKRRSFYLT